MRTNVLLVGALAVGTAVLVAPAGSAATDTDDTESTRAWTKVTQPNGKNTDEAAVARTDDGVLHVFWRARIGPNQEEIKHAAVSDGMVGAATTASGPWASAGNPAAIVAPDGGLRIFFGGLTGTNASLDGVQSASANGDGATWTQTGRVSSTQSAVPEGVGAASRPDGVPAFAYAHSFALGLHFGVDPATPDTALLTTTECCAYFPNLAFSDTDGDGYVAWYSNVTGKEGLWVQPIWPTVGTAAAVPESAIDRKAIAPSQRTAITAQAGTDGTYVAYCSGYPSCKDVKLWKVGDPSATTVATGTDIEDVNIAADPDGRLWVMWEDTSEHKLFAARTNDDASEVGAVVAVEPTDGATTVWKLQGNATSDELDVLASFTTGNEIATWHAGVLPGLGVTTKKSKNGVVFTVTDAGDPVRGAKVAFRRRTVTTNLQGRATAARGKGTATITMDGYTDATLVVK